MEHDNIARIGLNCTGCRACEQTCPKSCITMERSTEGFLYPHVNEDLCVMCGLCLAKCAQAVAHNSGKEPLCAYALQNKDEAELFSSASGGAADVAAKAVLRRGGVVFGAVYTDELAVKHVGIERDTERIRLRSSKYVQSDTANCYSQAKAALKQDRYVLFTGTPCQIDGLKTFLGRDYEKLFTLDLICHGVPSPLLFQKYVAYMGEQMGGRLIAYNFRSKEKRGWGTQYLAKTKTKSKTKMLALDKYGKHFLAGDCYRECCYRCPYADIHRRPADITVGDFWAVDKYLPEMSSKLGVSTVLINSPKGELLLSMAADYAQITQIPIEAALAKQSNLRHPTNRPAARDGFYENIDTPNFITKLKVGCSLKVRAKALLPRSVSVFLKRRLF